VASACKPVAGGYCDKICDCTGGCEEYQRDQCIDSVKQSRNSAQAAGCGDQFEDYLSCASSEVVCEGDDPAQAGSCEAEGSALVACGGSTSFSCVFAYQRIIVRYEQCGFGGLEGGGAYDCPPEVAQQAGCIAACTDAAPCTALTGEDPDAVNAYSECLGNCSF
jgi:hypothetical protein